MVRVKKHFATRDQAIAWAEEYERQYPSAGYGTFASIDPQPTAQDPEGVEVTIVRGESCE
jgi:hypothetical protein